MTRRLKIRGCFCSSGFGFCAHDPVVLGNTLLAWVWWPWTSSCLQVRIGSRRAYEQVKEHAVLGGDLIAVVQAAIPIAPMVQHHHERWDGRGYPHRLRGREIPLGDCIIAVCDFHEAKTTGRPGRKPLPFSRALQDLQAAAGSELDPEVVGALTQACWNNPAHQCTRHGDVCAHCMVYTEVLSRSAGGELIAD